MQETSRSRTGLVYASMSQGMSDSRLGIIKPGDMDLTA
jgi:hypothetical protein